MRAKEWWKLSVLNVFSSPLRSCLTVLGMAIGVGAILAVLTLGSAGQMQVRSEMKRLGIDRVWITGEETLRREDAVWLKKALQVEGSEQIYLPLEITLGENKTEAIIMGCTAEYLKMAGVYGTEGRLFVPLEWGKGGQTILLGETLAKTLGAAPNDELAIGSRIFTVCGIVNALGNAGSVNCAEAVFLPLEELLSLTGGMIHEIVLDIPSGVNPDRIASAAEKLMDRHRGTKVKTVTMKVQMDAANSVIDTFVNVLKWIALICMLVGGIGVMNILMVGVRERRREIGIMQALGTSRAQICRLFLLEALIYAAIGGVLGTLFGMGLTDAAGRSIGLEAQIRTGDCAAVLAAALITGLGFGVAPAVQASGLKPVEALRS